MRFTQTLFLLTVLAARHAAAANVAMVSAASGTSPVAPGSIVSIYGTNLASGSAFASSATLPYSLSNASATVLDSSGDVTDLPLFYVSATQINALIPTTVASGPASVTVTTPTGTESSSVTIAAIAPGLFSANETGKNAASAQIAINHSDGSQSLDNTFQCGAGAVNCVPINLDLSSGPAALVLYGTGIRGAASISDVSVTIGGQSLPVTFASAAPGYQGLDQVNVMLPQSLAGTGIANLSVNVNGTFSNVLTVSFGYATSAPACSGCNAYNNPPYTFATSVAGACNVSSVTKAATGMLYPISIWGPVSGKKVITQQATSANVDQIFVADVAADGTASNPVCISCSSPPAPANDLYKNDPSLRPQGDWVLMRVEDPSGPIINQSSPSNQQVVRNNGYYANLWVASIDGTKWYKMTNFTAPPGGNPGAFGELGPRWSADGSMVVFSETYKAPDEANLQGYWHMYLANFSVDSNGIPSFSNVTDISLPGDVFYEPQSFAPDGKSLVVQSYTPGINAYGVDLYSVNIAPGAGFGTYTDLTNSPFSWDEHAEFSPDGQKIVYITSLPFPNIIPEYGTLTWANFRNYLHNETFLMNADGTDVQQLTYFNTPSSPESSPQYADDMFPSWDLAGDQILVQMGGPDEPVPGGNSTWIVKFAGACGGSATQ